MHKNRAHENNVLLCNPSDLGSASFLSKGPDSKYFQLVQRRVSDLCSINSTLQLVNQPEAILKGEWMNWEPFFPGGAVCPTLQNTSPSH